MRQVRCACVRFWTREQGSTFKRSGKSIVDREKKRQP
ncbi:uncharacterized protein CCOS01_14068 [Colletotrichum costaricense]|uniref:Uncharacterized protein n=1 Tax=Colletotrichum costaricense TaxID=1209916 RepID=A0AAI9YK23_9PEZI|nr:uncharacterized protein CCOS01_14068 [Colletotrichum costaricense]KAI3528464.1 hypothetical protein CSPX01_16207 [Colletotrichum filicis]KAK1514128.1 hypothetical protein CCOS01_14068 [Colletotrichum costaricense]